MGNVYFNVKRRVMMLSPVVFVYQRADKWRDGETSTIRIVVETLRFCEHY
jgi:hypothetical protein